MSIYKKLNEFSQKVGAVRKNANNPFHKSKYATIESVIDTISGPLKECGIGYFQCVEDRFLVTTVYSLDEGGIITSRVPLLLQKEDMQQLGSAITYARRYALVSMFGLEQEDDDGNYASGKSTTQQKPPIKNIPVEIKYVSEDQVKQLEEMLKKIKQEGIREKFCIAFEIKSLKDMPMNRFASAVKKLQVTIDKEKEEKQNEK